MRGKIRQWFVDRPRAMDAAYTLMLVGALLLQVGVQDAGGGSAGP